MKKNLFLIAVATVVVAACSSDLDETSVVESCPVRLCTDGLTGMTRAGQSVQLTQFLADQQVGIFLAEDNGNGGPVTSGTNVTTYDQPLTYVANGSGGLANTQYWPQDGNGLHIFGVYPLAAATTAGAYNATGKSFSVQTDQTADANYMASDLMTGVPTAGNPVPRTANAVPLTFTHLLTKINVTLTAGSGFTQAEMANAVVSILGTKPTTTFNVQSANVGEASGDATAITAGTGAATSAIIVPQALAADASFIQVAVGGGNYIYKLPAAITFAPSTKYTYNLTVTKTGLTLSGTTITPWNSVAPIDGTAELLPPVTIDLSTITSDYTAMDGEILTGTLGSNVKISIADGATVTLSNVTINGVNNSSYQWAGINCLGDATIKLAPGTTNTVKGFYYRYAGIYWPDGSTLTIKGTGTLNAISNDEGAGIGANYQSACGNLVINGGTINATSNGDGAGIGGGREGACGDITINGGTITANGKGDGAGIGGGWDAACGDIVINGGTVTATSEDGAGIGGGRDGLCGDITINGGTVTATSKGDSAGIGGGWEADCGVIVINGGTVTATSEDEGAGIGSSRDGKCDDITISDCTVTATSANNGAGIGSGGDGLCGDITISNVEATINGGYDGAGIGAGRDASCGIITISNVDVTTTGGYEGSGIGTGRGGSCDDIIIESGTIIATAGRYGVGIGSGKEGIYNSITISGGTVTATGGYEGPGIGCAYDDENPPLCGPITISGGTVTANGGKYSAGIGTSYRYSRCGTITISGGTVTAKGGERAAGIGSGYDSTSQCGDVTILNTVTKVTATKGTSAQHSIGRGLSGTCGTVTIGGTIYWQDNAAQNDGDTYLATSPLVYPTE